MAATHRTPGLGINPGHGFVKIVLLTDGPNPQTITIPALVGQAQRQLVGAIKRVPTVDIAGGHWWVGEDALISKAPRTALNQDRIRDMVFIPALVKGALAQIQGNGQLPAALLADAQCVTGLPATWALERDLAAALVQRLRSAAHLGSIKVIAEPLGLLYAALLDDQGEVVGDARFQQGRVAVIDVGHHTVDVAVLQRLVPEPESLVTFQLGTARPLHTIQQRLAALYEVELPLYAVDTVVRTRQLVLAGATVALPSDWDAPLQQHGETIAAKLVEAFGSGRQFDAILIGGGGEQLPQLVAAIQVKFPHARPSGYGQIGVALGYARLARRLGKQREQHATADDQERSAQRGDRSLTSARQPE